MVPEKRTITHTLVDCDEEEQQDTITMHWLIKNLMMIACYYYHFSSSLRLSVPSYYNSLDCLIFLCLLSSC